MKIKLESVLKYLVVLMAILCSGTVIFNIKYNSIFIPLWCMFSALTNLINNGQRKVLINNLKVPCVIFCLILVNTIFWIADGVQLNGIAQIMFYMILLV